MGIAGRHSQEKEIVVDSNLRRRQPRRGKMARAVVLWASMRTERLFKKLTRIGVHDGFTILGTKVAAKHHVAISAVTDVIS